MEKHIWNDSSKATYGKDTNYFIKISDVRSCLDSASVVVKNKKANFSKISDNRYEIETSFNDVQRKNVEGINWKGEKKLYQAVQWVI